MSNHAFQRITDLNNLPEELRSGVVAIGNFDGVHRGHQVVLQRGLDEAAKRGAPALVLTFEPHPRTVFRPDVPVFRLTPPPVKAGLIAALGYNAVIEYPFDRDFSSLTAEQFVAEILQQGLGVSHVVTGFDFHFGKNRQGGPAFLMESGKTKGFGVSLVDAFRDKTAEVISSSRIREMLEEGDVGNAAEMLGFRFHVEAAIVRGKQLGRTLGYPTANMMLPADVTLQHGIYAVRFRRGDGSLYDGVASFGRRPTVDVDGSELLETYVFDFSGDLYDEICTVTFFGWLRGEQKFDNLDALRSQMKRDEEAARRILSTTEPLSGLDRHIGFNRSK